MWLTISTNQITANFQIFEDFMRLHQKLFPSKGENCFEQLCKKVIGITSEQATQTVSDDELCNITLLVFVSTQGLARSLMEIFKASEIWTLLEGKCFFWFVIRTSKTQKMFAEYGYKSLFCMIKTWI